MYFIMKKRIIAPIMSLIIIVTASVNYNVVSNLVNQGAINLSTLVMLSTANAEDPAPGGEQDNTYVEPECVEEIEIDPDTLEEIQIEVCE